MILVMQRMNLTAVKDENEAMERHVEDSLAIVEPIRSSYLSHCGTSWQNLNVIDVGSGAGLPGLILAIACPGNYSSPYWVEKLVYLFVQHAILNYWLILVERLETDAFGVYAQALCLLGACGWCHWFVECASYKR